MCTDCWNLMHYIELFIAAASFNYCVCIVVKYTYVMDVKTYTLIHLLIVWDMRYVSSAILFRNTQKFARKQFINV